MTVRVLVILGTRPEAIKLAPVLHSLREDPGIEAILCSTGQHTDMVSQALRVFDVEVDHQLNAMQSASSLGQLTSRLFSDLDRVLADVAPDWVVVQGDTTSAMVGAIAAFYRRINVGHVEAGLRTFNRWSPFPEEVNRVFISQVATLHFAPTQRAADNLVNAGVMDGVLVTGNTVVDALSYVRQKVRGSNCAEMEELVGRRLSGRRMILVTSHRREAFGQGLLNICNAILEIADRHKDSIVVFPVHLNPAVREPVFRLLGNHERILLLDPVDYLSMIWLMEHCFLILSDSGGIQEEAPSFGRPLLVMRENTERPEAVESGCAKLVGTDAAVILKETSNLMDNQLAYSAMAGGANPFGDGRSAQRIVNAILTRQNSPKS